MSDLEQQLTDHLRRLAAEATPRDDLEGIEGRGGDQAVVELTTVRRAQRPRLWLAVAAAFVLVVLVGALVFLEDESTVDVGTSTGPSEVPSWPAPVRPPSDVVHPLAEDGGPEDDPSAASSPWVDITWTSFWNEGSWGINLAAPMPLFESLEPGVVLSYGIVLDTNADGAPDYLAGISSDAPRRGDVRAWVTDLATGKTVETDKPPYGYPVEFGYRGGYGVSLTFLDASSVPGLDADTARWYAWTSETRSGVVFAHDYAPDTGWFSPPVAPAESSSAAPLPQAATSRRATLTGSSPSSPSTRADGFISRVP